jgi:formyl-CoA transferase
VFRAADEFLIVAVGNDTQFASFCAVIGAPQWAGDARFSTNPERVRHRDLIVGMISERLRARTSREWLALLEPAGVPCGPINDLAQVFADPQVRHRGMEVRAPHPAAGEVRMVANPMKFSATPIAHDTPPPTLGQHTDEILGSVLGMDGARIQSLRERGVI